jgi:hypothetical protein
MGSRTSTARRSSRITVPVVCLLLVGGGLVAWNRDRFFKSSVPNERSDTPALRASPSPTGTPATGYDDAARTVEINNASPGPSISTTSSSNGTGDTRSGQPSFPQSPAIKGAFAALTPFKNQPIEDNDNYGAIDITTFAGYKKLGDGIYDQALLIVKALGKRQIQDVNFDFSKARLANNKEIILPNSFSDLKGVPEPYLVGILDALNEVAKANGTRCQFHLNPTEVEGHVGLMLVPDTLATRKNRGRSMNRKNK